MHLPKLAIKTRPPRMLTVDFPLGLTFGAAHDQTKHWQVMEQLLDFAVNGGVEEVKAFRE